MHSYFYYHKDTGEIHEVTRVIAAADHRESAEEHAPADHVAVAGSAIPHLQRYDIASGTLVDCPVKAAIQAKLDARAITLSEIHSLEQMQPRVLREWALGKAGARERLQDIDDRIACHRVFL